MLGRRRQDLPATPPQTGLLSRRAVIGGAGVLLVAAFGGMGSAVGTDLYNGLRTPAPDPGADDQRHPSMPSVTVTTIGIAPKCQGYRLLVDRDPNEVAAEIARLPAYPAGRSADRASVRTWLQDPASRSDPSAPGTHGRSVDFPLKVSRTDPEVLDLMVGEVAGDCLWTAELDWTAAGESGHRQIDDNGNPFHASAAPSI